MSLHPQTFYLVPEQTSQVAQAAFPKGNIYMQMYDELGMLYKDQQFTSLFASRGRPAISPTRLALILVMQFAENLTDRQAADAVRARIDWKYALGLELTDAGFDFSVLSEFRDRLIANELEEQLLTTLLNHFKTLGLLKARGRQRTDSTHVLAAIHNLNRLELVGRTLQHALNQLAQLAPNWLQAKVPVAWFERYGRLVDEYRFPKGEPERRVLANTIGQDGQELLGWLAQADAPDDAPSLEAVKTLQTVWNQQFDHVEGQLRWRSHDELPASATRIASPHDDEARYSTKRSVTWVGYKVHVTETCEPDLPHLIVQVETTPATDDDSTAIPTIHAKLSQRGHTPSEHLVDAGYTSGEHIETSARQYGIDLVGPVPADNSWQTQDAQAFGFSKFRINWAEKQAVCPQGKVSQHWHEEKGPRGKPTIQVQFRRSDCRACPVRTHCTRSATGSRTLTLHPQAVHEALQNARQRQETDEFKQQYARRAGIEGTLSQAVNEMGIRRSRYIGQAKTHLQHVLTAAALNIRRVLAWWQEIPHATTRKSAFAALAPART